MPKLDPPKKNRKLQILEPLVICFCYFELLFALLRLSWLNLGFTWLHLGLCHLSLSRSWLDLDRSWLGLDLSEHILGLPKLPFGSGAQQNDSKMLGFRRRAVPQNAWKNRVPKGIKNYSKKRRVISEHVCFLFLLLFVLVYAVDCFVYFVLFVLCVFANWSFSICPQLVS